MRPLEEQLNEHSFVLQPEHLIHLFNRQYYIFISIPNLFRYIFRNFTRHLNSKLIIYLYESEQINMSYTRLTHSEEAA